MNSSDTGFDEYVEAYNEADFIVGRDGDEANELDFLVNWAVNAVKHMR